MNCGYVLIRASWARQSYPVRQYSAMPFRYETGTP